MVRLMGRIRIHPQCSIFPCVNEEREEFTQCGMRCRKNENTCQTVELDYFKTIYPYYN